MTPSYDHGGVTIWQGNALDVLRELPAESVQCAVTSPPFFQLRSYLPDDHPDKALEIGIEASLDDWLATLVAVFAEVRRVLKPDGVMFLECGDGYAGAGYSNHANTGGAQREDGGKQRHTRVGAVRPKSLLLMPHRLAIALSDEGWIVRSTIVWARPNPMPESVTDRPTTAHSYVFLLAKSERYYYDAAAIAEPGSPDTKPQNRTPRAKTDDSALKVRARNNDDFMRARWEKTEFRNKRSVWTIPTEPLREEHYAAFPTALVRPCILAGSRPGDIVLDPFAGSGTSLLVAKRLERRAWGIELSEAYVRLAARRVQQDVMPLFGDAAG